MTIRRKARWFVSALVIVLLPGLAIAEVSVLPHPQNGSVIKVFYLTGRMGGGEEIIWSQVRAGVPLEYMLNPLGDNFGDLAPTLRTHPVNGAPWAVWPANVANVKQIVVSSWDGKRWTKRQPVVASPDPLFIDGISPDLAFDRGGRPFLVWERSASTGSIEFSTLSNGVWTPPLRLSQEGIDSRSPSITVSGDVATIRFRTPAGWVTIDYATSVMVESAGSLMDTPIPPGNSSGSGDSGGGHDEDGDRVHRIPK
jgi:hypothetical protein